MMIKCVLGMHPELLLLSATSASLPTLSSTCRASESPSSHSKGVRFAALKMEAAAVLQSSAGICRPPNSGARSGIFTAKGPNFMPCSVKIKQFSSISHSKAGSRRVAPPDSKRAVMVRASMSSNSGGTAAPIAPLQLESPIGQFLSQILVSHPHLVPAAVDQQLEQLQTDRAAEKNQESSTASGTELVLYRRIAEVKANERRKTLEEILYALVVQKFMDVDVPLVPTISAPSSYSCVDKKLQHMHSPEACEMIQNHLSLILGNRTGDSTSVAEISKLRLGQVYAASVMYGYFLKRVDQRFQLEKAMKNLPRDLEERSNNIQAVDEERRPGGDGNSFRAQRAYEEVASLSGGISSGSFDQAIKPSRLRTYVMSFDADTLQKYAIIRSKEAVSIIEKHTEALFGRPEIALTPEGTVDRSKDELIKISFGGLKTLVLEAVTFGSFLWDVETYVDSRYHFVMF